LQEDRGGECGSVAEDLRLSGDRYSSHGGGTVSNKKKKKVKSSYTNTTSLFLDEQNVLPEDDITFQKKKIKKLVWEGRLYLQCRPPS